MLLAYDCYFNFTIDDRKNYAAGWYSLITRGYIVFKIQW
jgi:hypothetical protein